MSVTDAAQGREVLVLYRGVLVAVAVTLAVNAAILLPRLGDVRPEAEYSGFASLIVILALAPGLAMLAVAALFWWRARVGALRIILTLAAALWGGSVTLLIVLPWMVS